MRPRAVGGFEPDERDQAELVELWHISRTALAPSIAGDRMTRIGYVVTQFVKAHAGEPDVAHKWIHVWAVDHLGLLVQPSSSSRARSSAHRGVSRRR